MFFTVEGASLMKRRLILLILLLVLPFGAARAQKRAFNIEDLYRVKSISDVHLSPDGKTVVYAVATSDLSRAKRTTQIWLMDADGRNPRQITQGEKSSASPTFSPDGRWIAFVSDRDGSPNLYVMTATGTEVRRVT